ncbi:hypothetical protein BDV12DRAFT_91328 [Aspergillus spectabilis]
MFVEVHLLNAAICFLFPCPGSLLPSYLSINLLILLSYFHSLAFPRFATTPHSRLLKAAVSYQSLSHDHLPSRRSSLAPQQGFEATCCLSDRPKPPSASLESDAAIHTASL